MSRKGASESHHGWADFIGVALLATAVLLAMAGTTLSRRVLEAMSDVAFRAWTQRLILAIGTVYTAQGLVLLLRG